MKFKRYNSTLDILKLFATILIIGSHVSFEKKNPIQTFRNHCCFNLYSFVHELCYGLVTKRNFVGQLGPLPTMTLFAYAFGFDFSIFNCQFFDFLIVNS